MQLRPLPLLLRLLLLPPLLLILPLPLPLPLSRPLPLPLPHPHPQPHPLTRHPPALAAAVTAAAAALASKATTTDCLPCPNQTCWQRPPSTAVHRGRRVAAELEWDCAAIARNCEGRLPGLCVGKQTKNKEEKMSEKQNTNARPTKTIPIGRMNKKKKKKGGSANQDRTRGGQHRCGKAFRHGERVFGT